MGVFDQLPIIEDPEEARCPCLLLLDVSSSMSGQRIEELNRGIKQFAVKLGNDSLASKRVEIGIVTFGSDVVVHSDFVSARDFRPEQLTTSGLTPMGRGILTGLSMLEERKTAYKKNGINFYRPWIFLITDGGPTDADEQHWPDAVARIHQGEQEKKFALFTVGVEGADFSRLREVSVRDPLQLKGLKFHELFLWLSSSLASVSRSNPGDEVSLQNPSGWGAAPT
jgi:uncharacterized protein YegL